MMKLLVSRLLLCALLVSIVPSRALADTFYVGPSGLSGNQGTEASPWNITKGVSALDPGDTLVFLDGVYTNQSITLSRSGSPGAPITLQAAEGALPILRGASNNMSSGFNAGVVIHDVVIDGLWFENWRYSGIDVSYGQHGCSNIVIKNTVVDLNQVNGISPYYAHDVTIENNIVSRNGWGPSSWSSNVNVFAVTGNANVVRGNVSFHGIDTSANQSDGNGFILDITIDQGSALFENNIGFANGGACIAVTDSGGARLVGNTCFQNARAAATYMDEFNVGNTCRDMVSGVNVGMNSYSFDGYSFKNNVAIARSGKDGLNTYDSCGNQASFTGTNNFIESSDGDSVLEDPAALDFRPQSGSALLGAANESGTAAYDIGFDPKCIHAQAPGAGKPAWWTHAPDESYIKSLGGVKYCFSPRLRPQGSGLDIGAYEFDDGGGLADAGSSGGAASAGSSAGGSSAGGAGGAIASAGASMGGLSAAGSMNAAGGATATAGANTGGRSGNAGPSAADSGCACSSPRPGSPVSISFLSLGLAGALAALLLGPRRRRR